MIAQIPKYLFRGDRDSKNERLLRTTIRGGVILTNLCNGGNGREIFDKPFSQLIIQHVGNHWEKTNFLSFSSDENRAFYYGCENKKYNELYDYQENWSFAILTFDTSLLEPKSIIKIRTGVFSATYEPTCSEFFQSFKIILIDTLTYLKSQTTITYDLEEAIINAERDKEWLILPANPFGYNGELSAKLDTKCISNRIFISSPAFY